jgi:hypothetical protein
MFFINFYCFLGSLMIFIWLYLKRSRSEKDYLKSCGILFEKPLPVIGNLLPVLMKKEGIMQMMKRLYSKYNSEK